MIKIPFVEHVFHFWIFWGKTHDSITDDFTSCINITEELTGEQHNEACV
jgi:hypothetical protein